MIQAFQDSLSRGETGYSPSYGLPVLRTAIAKDEQAKGWDCSDQDVYVCHGVTEALQIIFAAVQSQVPKYSHPVLTTLHMAYPQMFGGGGRICLKNDDGWKIDFEDIENKMDEKYDYLSSSIRTIQPVMLLVPMKSID